MSLKDRISQSPPQFNNPQFTEGSSSLLLQEELFPDGFNRPNPSMEVRKRNSPIYEKFKYSAKLRQSLNNSRILHQTSSI